MSEISGTSLAFIIITFLLAIGYGVYSKVYVPITAQAGFAKAQSLTSSIDRAKVDNSNQYPAGSGAITSSNNTTIYNQLGGNVADISTWTYSCTAGSNQTLTITTETWSSSILANLISKKTNSLLSPYTSAVNGSNQVVITLSGVVCN